jgi:divalent metal cation (Fe/Co/Zn/Cd) transporter
MLGLMIAFAGVALAQFTGAAWLDGLASVLIGVLLAATAIWLAYETKSLLIGERANRRIIDGVRELAGSIDIVEHVNEVLTMHMEPDYILVNISLDIRDDAPAGRLEEIVAGLDCEIKSNYSGVKRVFIEARNRRGQKAS